MINDDEGSMLKFLGIISGHDNMERLIGQGKKEDARKRGWSPTRWTD